MKSNNKIESSGEIQNVKEKGYVGGTMIVRWTIHKEKKSKKRREKELEMSGWRESRGHNDRVEKLIARINDWFGIKCTVYCL